MTELKHTVVSFVLLAATFWPLERLFAARPGQPWLGRVRSIDTLYFLTQYLVWSGLTTALLFWSRPYVLAPEALRQVFDRQPLALRVVEAVVAGDLLVYWFHRACHQVPLLWRFHAVHHSAPQVDWLAAHREHPLDGLFTVALINLPLLTSGLPLAAVGSIVGFRGLWAIFVHSNVRLPLGPLRLLFGAPELHRWHHAQVDITRHNFANLAPYLDKLFGTYWCPTGDEAWPVGLGAAYPQTFITQHLAPPPEATRTEAG